MIMYIANIFFFIIIVQLQSSTNASNLKLWSKFCKVQTTLTLRDVSKVCFEFCIVFGMILLTAAVQRKYEYLRRTWYEEEKMDNYQEAKREAT